MIYFGIMVIKIVGDKKSIGLWERVLGYFFFEWNEVFCVFFEFRVFFSGSGFKVYFYFLL